MNKNIFLFGLVGVSILFFQCGENPFGAGMENEVEIEILSSQFNPSSITIDVGTKVVWINKTSETHGVDAGIPRMADTGLFEGSSNILPDDPPFVLAFTERGTFNYYCSVHQANFKTGTIIVR